MKSHVRERWLLSLICSVILPFNFFIYGTVDVFAHNSGEFGFLMSDFIWFMVLFTAAAATVLFAALILLPDKAYPALLGLIIGLSVMCLLQPFFLNVGVTSLADKITVKSTGVAWLIIDSLLWVGIIGGCVFAAYKIKKVEWVKFGTVILVITVCGMSASGTVAAAISYQPPVDDYVGINYLSTDGLYEVAPGKNVVVFLIDRFDAKYRDRVVDDYPDFFSPLTGFTYFSDNLSEYSATYPSVCHMISGERQDFSRTANEFFTAAYNDSAFFNDLKSNGFSIRIYSDEHYAYRNETPMTDYIENARVTDHYIIKDRSELVRQMLSTSVIRCSPSAVKVLLPGRFYEFKSVTDVEEGATGVFSIDDPEVCRGITEGISVAGSEYENGYVFYHFNGCHYPYSIDENGNRSEDSSAPRAAIGCFKAIYSYIEQLKALGLYEDATIIITGDHSAGYDGDEDDPPMNGTALFFKPAGKSGEPLAESGAQVCDANMLRSIVLSAGIVTDHDYGRGYFEIGEDETPERTALHFSDAQYCTEYTVKGAWRDKDNWVEISKTEIDGFYK